MNPIGKKFGDVVPEQAAANEVIDEELPEAVGVVRADDPPATTHLDAFVSADGTLVDHSVVHTAQGRVLHEGWGVQRTDGSNAYFEDTDGDGKVDEAFTWSPTDTAHPDGQTFRTGASGELALQGIPALPVRG